MEMTRKNIRDIFDAALKAVDPYLLVKNNAEIIINEFRQKQYRDIVITGFGKASFQMAKAAEEVFGADLIAGGIIVTKYGHSQCQMSADSSQPSGKLRKIEVYEAGHPIPDNKGLEATEKIVNLLEDADERTLVLCLVSGGGSALLVSPYDGITLKEKQSVTDLLLKAGADINELNAVRKHISKVKGGRLAGLMYPSHVISLIISDVIGDRLDVIASGPASPDTSTFRDAIVVMRKYDLMEKAPESVIDVLTNGLKGEIPDTPKPGDSIFKNVQNIIIADNRKALDAAESRAQSNGYQTEVSSSDITGEAREVGRLLAEKAKEIRLRNSGDGNCLISGGETTVTVKGRGRGGRNTELALSFAMGIEGMKGITLLSAGTDGTDGPTDAAGAIADGETVVKAKALGLNPREFLDNNDSYTFFKKTDSLVMTGPTGTNVMDVQILVVE